ncbi:MAG: E3 binding domain-containing protein, partial [Thermodesulfovibrionales bacterium]
QVVLEIETDKAVVEVPSPVKGKVLRINKDTGEVAKVGEVLMIISGEGEIEEKAEPIKEERSVSVVGTLPEEEEVLATPAVRALAKELGVKIEEIKGSGPGGSITKEDIIEASKRITPVRDQYGTVERLPIRGLRRTISKNLLQSRKTTAFVTGMDEADITELWYLREREK